MKLKQTGKYFELPIAGLKIKEIVFDGMIKLVFDDNESSYLEFHSPFKVAQYNQLVESSPRDKAALVFFYDHFEIPVKEAKADNRGNLWLTFNSGTEINVEDGPYENWHYTKKSINKSGDSLHVHGGVGRTAF
jgi:hypothetical protein